jgi:hypothetical protein
MIVLVRVNHKTLRFIPVPETDLRKNVRYLNSYVYVHHSAKNLGNTLYKKVNDFPVPSRDVTDQTLPGREGDGKMANLFLQ